MIKCLALALVGFWVVLGAVVVIVALTTADEPSPSHKVWGPMTCASLQARAERCADGLSDLAGDLYAEYMKQQGESAVGDSTQRFVVVTAVHGAIGDKKVAAYCKRYWDSEHPRIRQVRAQVAACFKKPGCKDFIECLRKVARQTDLTGF